MVLRNAVHAIVFAAWLSPIVTEKQLFLFFRPQAVLEIFGLPFQAVFTVSQEISLHVPLQVPHELFQLLMDLDVLFICLL